MAATFRPRRSALYMPGSNARALEKARAIDADVLILDLEDAVAPDAKDVARRQIVEAVTARNFGHREVVVRVNALSTPWGAEDLKALAGAKPDAVLVPKVGSGEEAAALSKALDGAGADPSVALWVMFETPQAVLNAASLGAAGGRLACLVAGTNDLVKEFRGQHTPGREGLLPSLVILLAAARANGLAALDGVHNDITDLAALETICQQGRALGFDGKTLIHPSQIEACNAIFAPTEEEVSRASAVIAAFALPENAGKGVIKVDGKMTELLHLEEAKRVVALSEAISQRS